MIVHARKYTGTLFLGTVLGLFLSPASADIQKIIVKPFVAKADQKTDCPKAKQ